MYVARHEKGCLFMHTAFLLGAAAKKCDLVSFAYALILFGYVPKIQIAGTGLPARGNITTKKGNFSFTRINHLTRHAVIGGAMGDATCLACCIVSCNVTHQTRLFDC